MVREQLKWLAALVVVVVVVVVAASGLPAVADYEMCTPEQLDRSATAIVDATITEFDEKGRAIIEVHRFLKGDEAPTLLRGFALTCDDSEDFRGSSFEAGERYILYLDKDQVYEASTWYQSRQTEEGALQYFEKEGANAGDLGGLEGPGRADRAIACRRRGGQRVAAPANGGAAPLARRSFQTSMARLENPVFPRRRHGLQTRATGFGDRSHSNSHRSRP